MKRRELWFVTGLTFLSAIFKILALTMRSLWLDEGYTLYRIASSWAMNFRNQISLPQVEISADPHPPVYYLFTKGLMTLAGNSEFVIKLVSAFAGILFVPLVFVMARRLFNTRTALIAAVFAALSPLVGWYSDELRSYALVATEAALCVYLAYRALTNGGKGIWLAWGIALLAAQFTHWAYIGFVLAHVLATAPKLLDWSKSIPKWKVNQKGLLAAGLLGAIALLSVAAWLFDAPSILKRMTTGAEYGFTFIPLHTFIASIFSGTLFGVNLIDPTSDVLTWLAFALFVLSVMALWRARADREHKYAVYLAFASAIGSPAVWFAISLIKPNYHGIRHLIMSVPPIMVIFAAAIDLALASASKSMRWAGRACLAILLMCFSAGFATVYLPTPEKEDNWREMAYIIRDGWQEGDVLLGNAGTPLHVLRSYVGQQVPISTLYTSDLGSMTLTERNAFYAAHSRVWFANTGGAELDKGEATDLAGARELKKVHVGARTTTLELLLLELRPRLLQTLPADAVSVPVDANARGAQIAAYAIGPGSPFAQDPWVKLSLFWRRGAGDVAPPNVSLRLENNAELWLAWNSDAWHFSAPSDWKGDGFWQIDYAMPVPLGLPDQPYRLKLTASAVGQAQVIDQPLNATTFARVLRITKWNPVEAAIPQLQTGLARMDEVQATFNGAVSTPGTDARRVADFGEVALTSVVHAEVIHPGDTLPLAFNWQPRQAPLVGWDNEARLEPLIGGAVAQTQHAAGTKDAPVSAWKTGELYRDQLSLQTPFSISPGVYRLQVSRVQGGRAVDGALAGWVRVENYAASPVPSPITQTLNAKIGETTLLGWQPPMTYTRGSALDVRTFWRFEAQPAREGVLFIHVVGPDGKVMAQYDNAPLDGARDTRSFRAGDGLDQHNFITLNPDLAGGEYTIFAGIYNRTDVIRWQATQDGAPAKDNLVRLGSFVLPNAQNEKIYLPVIARPNPPEPFQPPKAYPTP